VRPRRVCLVGADLGGLNAHRERGAAVHLLWCGTGTPTVPIDVSVTLLDSTSIPSAFQTPNLYEPSHPTPLNL